MPGLGAGTAFTGTAFTGTVSEEPRCTRGFLFLRCLRFFEKTWRKVLRNLFPTRRTAFVTRRNAPFLAFRCFLVLGVGGAAAGAGAAAGVGVALGFPPR